MSVDRVEATAVTERIRNVRTQTTSAQSLLPQDANGEQSKPLNLTRTSASPCKRNRPKLPTRWSLYLQARVWRFLEQIGLWLHMFPKPIPPRPTLVTSFTASTLNVDDEAQIELVFYTPKDYTEQVEKGKRYPVVVNFHGGGFTLGRATDDARWAGAVLDQTDAIVVSVEYRLAPEFPFPAAVDDCAEALLYLADNAEAYGIDPHRIALSGFSAGGNLAFTMLLRLQIHLQSIKNEIQSKAFDGPAPPPAPTLPQVISLVSWYPALDQRLTRDERRATVRRPEKTIPPILTTLFDDAYMLSEADKASPLASPSAATDADLVAALPSNIVIYLCEWDMLQREGQEFVARLETLGINVFSVTIAERVHGFDKNPYPFSLDPKITQHYRHACSLLNQAFQGEGPSQQ